MGGKLRSAVTATLLTVLEKAERHGRPRLLKVYAHRFSSVWRHWYGELRNEPSHSAIMTTRGIPVDSLLTELVELLWAYGVETTSSCQGDRGATDQSRRPLDNDRYSAIIIFANFGDAARFAERLARNAKSAAEFQDLGVNIRPIFSDNANAEGAVLFSPHWIETATTMMRTEGPTIFDEQRPSLTDAHLTESPYYLTYENPPADTARPLMTKGPQA